ncbi:polysaccharide deacetylase family protein [bacterium]|nr:polysaccharide deacetylase family protein [bacterium]
MLSDKRPIVLAFHKVMSKFSFGATNYSPGRMYKLLTRLADQGFSFADESRATEGPRLLLTFDDGYAHLADSLPPLMERFRLTPLVFVPTAWLGLPNRWDYSHLMQNTPHLSRAQIRQLAGIGVRFGSHGHSHCDMTGLSESELKRELQESKAELEQATGERVTDLSYPFGRVDERVEQFARQTGYTTGYTMKLPAASDPPLRTGRVPVYGFDSPGAVVRRIRGRRVAVVTAKLTHALSGGTILLNRLRGM